MFVLVESTVISEPMLKTTFETNVSFHKTQEDAVEYYLDDVRERLFQIGELNLDWDKIIKDYKKKGEAFGIDYDEDFCYSTTDFELKPNEGTMRWNGKCSKYRKHWSVHEVTEPED